MNARARRLVVLRHAQAEPSAATDAERPLSARGRTDAAAAGTWLAGLGIHVGPPTGSALVSAALRTRQTYDALAGGAGWEGGAEAARHDEGLYSAGPEAALDLVRETADEVSTLLVVGHNPTMAYLAHLLDDGEGDPGAGSEMVARGYPTCAAAVFAVDVPWADLAPGRARLEAFHVARG
ncbi:SixA phosphatase family protein [Nocardioides sp. AX2bis]|uniref:SixA phosphatase family protein n=1 Tax=Nocardioides sp. AX2bis TaxID=2653157 RepID=UPI0012EF6870|nr:histidine phosphatase family protein [Nocardioides sp. AX2bis]VXB51782.1 Phosphohistidine phosphatase [Nocardioides sp. AX2bis]